MMMMSIKYFQSEDRYFLGRDGSGHWYLVPEVNRSDWDQWRDIGEDDPASWEPPIFADRIFGSPSFLTFEKPIAVVVHR